MDKNTKDSLGCLVIVISIISLISFIAYYFNSEWGNYVSAKHSDRFQFYQEFIDEYPESKYSDEIYQLTAKSLRQFPIDSYSFYKARGVDSMTISAYTYMMNEVLEKYADNHKFVKILEDEYREYSTEYWNNLVDKKDVKGIYRFPLLIPESYNTISMKEYKETVKSVWGSDDNAWQIAKSYDREWAYDTYMELFPKGKYFKEAKRLSIEKYLSDLDKNKNKGTLPSLGEGRPTGTNSSYISIYNRTTYKIKVVYMEVNGGDMHKEIISSYSRVKIKLKNGTYKVGASVLDGNVSSYSGVEKLEGMHYDVEYYISSRMFRY